MSVSEDKKNAWIRMLVENALAEYGPAYRNGEEIDGADLVDFFGEFLANVRDILAVNDSPVENSREEGGGTV